MKEENYGMTPERAEIEFRPKISRKETSRLVKSYFKMYPDLKNLMKDRSNDGRNQNIQSVRKSEPNR
jgi:DNA polymerase I-like protein with 3'-5' exonuclease and polymerase domains